MIVVYQALGDAPEHMRFCASIHPADRKAPCWTSHGATAEEARGKLEAFLNPPPKKRATGTDAPTAQAAVDDELLIL